MQPGVLPAYAGQGGQQPEDTEGEQQGQTPSSPMLLRDVQPHGSVGDVHCPFPSNEVLPSISSDKANTNP